MIIFKLDITPHGKVKMVAGRNINMGTMMFQRQRERSGVMAAPVAL